MAEHTLEDDVGIEGNTNFDRYHKNISDEDKMIKSMRGKIK